MLNRYGVPLPDSRPAIVQPKTKNRFRVLFYGFGQSTESDDRALSVNVDETDKPTVSFDLQEYRMNGSHTFDYGLSTWDPVNIVIRDTVDNSSIIAISTQLAMMTDAKRLVGQSVNTKFEMWIQTMNGDDARDLEGDVDIIEKYTDELVDGALTILAPVAGKATASAVDLAGDLTGIPTEATNLISGIADATAQGFIYPTKQPEFYNTLDTWVLQGCIVSNFDFDTNTYASSDYSTISLTVQPDNCFLLDGNGLPMATTSVDSTVDTITNTINDISSLL